MNKFRAGFTIVELLIVIVVIAILAAITIVAYNGIRNRAESSRITSEFSQASKLLEAARATEPDNISYPATAPSSLIGGGFSYTQAGGGKGFCLVKQYADASYFVTSASTVPLKGSCAGMLGWWKLNGNYADSSGNGRDMVVSGADPVVVTGQNGQTGSAYSFSSAQFLAYNNATAGLDLNTPMTISGWSYNQSSPGSHRGIFGMRSGGTSSFYVLQLANSLQLECRRQATSGTADGGGMSIVPSAWNFIAFVYDGGGVRCFVNGVMGATATQTTPLASVNQQFRIGSDGSGNNFVGPVDDVRWYARALSMSELQEMYQQNAQ